MITHPFWIAILQYEAALNVTTDSFDSPLPDAKGITELAGSVHTYVSGAYSITVLHAIDDVKAHTLPICV